MKNLITISSIFFIFICCSGTEELGIFGDSRNEDILGQDGVTPIPISDSVCMWTFGDTVLGTWKKDPPENSFFEEKINISDVLSNSLAFTEAPSGDNITNLTFRFLKKGEKVCRFLDYNRGEDPKNVRLWPVDGIRIGNKVYVYYYVICSDRIDIPFYLKAVGIALWEIPENWETGMDVGFIRLPDIFPENSPGFGSAVFQRDGYIYTAGHITREDSTTPIKIARTKPGTIENGKSYEFLSGDGTWLKDQESAGLFLDDVMGECSISYNKYLDKFIIIYCQAWTGNIIMVMFSEFKELKYADKKIVYQPPMLTQKRSESLKFYYSGKEIFSSGGSIYAIYINPVEYQPYLIKIKTGFSLANYFN